MKGFLVIKNVIFKAVNRYSLKYTDQETESVNKI